MYVYIQGDADDDIVEVNLDLFKEVDNGKTEEKEKIQKRRVVKKRQWLRLCGNICI